MEEILRSRLELRRSKLIELSKETAAIINLCEKEGVAKHVLQDSKTSLQLVIDRFQTESLYFIEKSSGKNNNEFMQSCMKDQVAAETLVDQITVLLQDSAEPSPAETKSRGVAKLPKLELPKYEGNILRFTEFWDAFEANVHSQNLKDVEKMSYLLASLEGSAKEAVVGLTTTNSNYLIAVDLLKKQFGTTEKVIDAHFEALNNLERARNDKSDCRQTLNAIEKHLRILENLHERVDSSHLRVMISSKFPDTVMYQVNLLTPEDRSVKSIKLALDKVITAMELADHQDFIKFPDAHATQTSTTEALHARVEKYPPKRKYVASKVVPPKRRKIECIFCHQSHYSYQCRQFKTVKERKNKLQGKCYICFRAGHNSKQCTSKFLCVHCKKRHNRALCFRSTISESGIKFRKEKEKVNRDDQQPPAVSGNIEPKNLIFVAKDTSNNCHHFLQTAVAKIDGHKCRILIDSGSQRSYVTSRIAKELNLIPDKEDILMVYTFGSDNPKQITSPSVKVEITTKRGIKRRICVNIVPHITNGLPVAQIDADKVDLLADDNSLGERIDLLIGNDFYYSFMKQEHIQLMQNMFLVNSDFGWIVTGNLSECENDHALSVMTYCQCHQSGCPYFTEPDLPLRNIDMRFLWTLESIGITDSPKTSREEEAVKFFNETTLYKDGRYEVKWPWVQYPPDLPTNFGIAFGRLKGLIKRLDSDALQEYNDILREQLQANIIEIVEPKTSLYEQTTPPITYLPHHMVKQRGKKGRIVYDASAKGKSEKSLNESLYSGPSMLEDLVGLILNFRIGKIGITADVEKAFLQVALQNQDRDVTRFLWVKDPTKELSEDNLIHLRFCRVPFGIISSPFLLTATIRHHIAKTNKTLLSQVADKCYVDNLVLSVQSEDEAIQVYNETRRVFSEISMNIRDWISNSKHFLQKIPECHRAKNTENVKILGLVWNIEQDSLNLNLENMTETYDTIVTKKDNLRSLARLYDPCGFVAPAIMPAKLLFQNLCIKKIKWDEPIPNSMKESWLSTLDCLKSTKDIQVPRYVGNAMLIGEIQYELHCFCDASKDAYACVVYLRMICQTATETAFLMSKSRVTPVENKDNLKIPRLELLAYLIGSRLLKYVKANIHLEISRQVLWSDSLVVLAWMKTSKLLPPFVQRRVNEIKLNKELELRYVNTKANPADVATRPELWQFKQDLWFYGPDFLSQDDETWPTSKQVSEESTFLVGEVLDLDDDLDVPTKDSEAYDEEPMYIDSTVLEFSVPVTEKDTEKEYIASIKKLQSEFFPQEVIGKETHLSRNLALFTDIDGVLRCKGRMTNTNWPYDQKYPILLPKDSTFTTEVIQQTHNDNFHVGVAHTLGIIRQKYWIPQGRAQVKKVLSRCTKCIKHSGGPYKLPPAPALPAERASYSTPFTYVGMDYLGPLYVNVRCDKEKRWICLFTCLAVRAIHLEVVNDLTAEECLLAVRRFIAARGLPKKIISDNAMYFKLTSEVLTRPYCMENGISWRFITQLAPWHVGFYERLVALVKNCLKRTLDKHLLSDHQLMTIVKEIEKVVNSRPLTCIGTEPEHVLKPSDFLSLGSCLTPAPSHQVTGSETITKIDLLKSWKRGHAVLNDFKHMFVNQYLLNLRERYHHLPRQPRVKVQREPRVDDVVQIKEDTKNRGNWKIGKISSLIRSSDGQCRSARVKVGNTELIRSIGHLYPLEVNIDHTDVSALREHKQSEDTITDRALSVDREQYEESVYIDGTVEKVTDHQDLDNINEDCVMKDRVPEQTSLSDSQVPATSDRVAEPLEELTEVEEVEESRPMRNAAIRARHKIAEWTRQLAALL